VTIDYVTSLHPIYIHEEFTARKRHAYNAVPGTTENQRNFVLNIYLVSRDISWLVFWFASR